MDPLFFILLIVTIIILIAGIMFLVFLVINDSKRREQANKDIMIQCNHEAMNSSNDINMRLIAILTEIVLGKEPMSQEDVQNYSKDIKDKDNDIIKNILNPEPSKPYDPFATIIPDAPEESESNDNINTESAVYKPENK